MTESERIPLKQVMTIESYFIFRKTHLTLFLGLLGSVIGAGIILYKAQATESSQAFVRLPEFLIWLLLVCLQTGFLAIVFIPLIKMIKGLKPYFANNKTEIIYSSLMISLLLWVPSLIRSIFLTDIHWPLTFQEGKLEFIVVITFIPILVANIGIWLIHAAYRNIYLRKEFREEKIPLFQQLQHAMDSLLAILGIMISLATLAVGALRNALIVADRSNAAHFPPVLVWIYGGYLSILLLLVYFLVNGSRMLAGNQILETCIPLPFPNMEAWEENYTKREKLREFLRLEKSFSDSLQTIFLIVSPLISGYISTLV